MHAIAPKWIIAALAILVLCGGAFMLLSQQQRAPAVESETLPTIASTTTNKIAPTLVIGTSVEGRAIEAYSFANFGNIGNSGNSGGRKPRLLFVGGIHGGYEWNSVVLAYQLIDYLTEHPDVIPPGLTVTVIPSANPDGVYKVVEKDGRITVLDIPKHTNAPVGTGRFNANGVDLNRNFDCEWQPKSMWRGNVVSAGTHPFSEPEALALRDYILAGTVADSADKPDAVIFWHSQANSVYASQCEKGILPETLAIMKAYAGASGYAPVTSFDAYEVTGDAEGWLASIGIPAITVELKTHETVEWEQNIAGITALFEYYREKAK